MIGNKITRDGKTYYCKDYTGEGFIFKDEQAFENNTDDVCYIPEYGFADLDPAFTIDGEDYYEVKRDNCYTRKDLEDLYNEWLEDHKEELEENGEYYPLEFIFGELDWMFPETYLNELIS